jgi:hypothetical protein
MEAPLAPFGWTRVIASGAWGRFHPGVLDGDLRRTAPPGASPKALAVVEVKRRRGGQQQVRRWLAQGHADLLLLDGGGGGEPLAIMDLATLERLLDEAGYRVGACMTRPTATHPRAYYTRAIVVLCCVLLRRVRRSAARASQRDRNTNTLS